MAEREPDWDMILEQRAEMERDRLEAESMAWDWEEGRVNRDMFHCPSCGAMPGEPHREPCPF